MSFGSVTLEMTRLDCTYSFGVGRISENWHIRPVIYTGLIFTKFLALV